MTKCDALNTPLVTVVIPVYNQSSYITDCLKSVIKQSYKNIEIIIINDGSTDGSAEICNRFACDDERIMLIDQNNQGAAKSRNLGIKKAKGEYIIFVDADDSVNPRYVEKLITRLIKYNTDISICGFMNIGKHNRVVTLENDKVGILYDDYAELPTNTVCLQGPVCKCYKAEIIKKYCIEFPENVRYGEDQQFNLKYFSHVSRYCFVKDVLYNYFRRGWGESLSLIYNKETLKEEFISMARLDEFLKKNNIKDCGMVMTKQAYQMLARFQYNTDFSYRVFKDVKKELKKYNYKMKKRSNIIINIISFLLNRNAYFMIFIMLKCVRKIRKV